MEPLRLTWKLGSPIVASAHPLHLDSLVAYALVEETLCNLTESGKGKDDKRLIRELAEQPLPLGREEREGAWCWQASALLSVSDDIVHSTGFWTRKTDVYDHAERIEAGQIKGRYKFPLKPYELKLDMERGLFKQQLKYFPIRQVSEVQAYCIGDADRLLELLEPGRHISHLGAKTRMGYGKVVSFEIEPDTDAQRNWSRRVLPWEHEGAVQMELAVRPPYWAVENRQLAWARPDLFA
ncbi:type IV CRISPR-associated protein Csf3 [Paraburkholderia youngii]|uniref:type IV CRISPR-associated protein Csf3 n=1 Tax=Paraburkholderia youngii TaxID=2782701 RepID=UPI003D1A76E5